jgi:hypothetical protein
MFSLINGLIAGRIEPDHVLQIASRNEYNTSGLAQLESPRQISCVAYYVDTTVMCFDRAKVPLNRAAAAHGTMDPNQLGGSHNADFKRREQSHPWLRSCDTARKLNIINEDVNSI